MPKTDIDHIKNVYIESDLLFSEAEVQQSIRRLASEITAEFMDQNPVVFTIMNGGLIFSGQLLPMLNFPLEAGYMHATRYRNTTSGHELEWKVPPMIDFTDRPVLILEDLLDEGHTLVEIVRYCKEHGASSVSTVVMANKQHDRKAIKGMTADFVGLEVEDRYIFGYGLDYHGYWRNAPGIFAVKGM